MGAPGTRTVAGRPDQQDSSGLRRLRPPARAGGHRRQHQRLHPVHDGDGGDPGAPNRPRSAPHQALSCHRRQGLQLEGDPRLAAAAGHRSHDPRAGRPGPQTVSSAAAAVADPRPSTSGSTSGATWWNGASTG
jgi:hypothetical protein